MSGVPVSDSIDEDRMFSEPTIHSVDNLFNAPGLGLEFAAAGVLALGVVCYLARVTWIALSHARRMELEAMQAVAMSSDDYNYSGPYCAG